MEVVQFMLDTHVSTKAIAEPGRLQRLTVQAWTWDLDIRKISFVHQRLSCRQHRRAKRNSEFGLCPAMKNPQKPNRKFLSGKRSKTAPCYCLGSGSLCRSCKPFPRPEGKSNELTQGVVSMGMPLQWRMQGEVPSCAFRRSTWAVRTVFSVHSSSTP